MVFFTRCTMITVYLLNFCQLASAFCFRLASEGLKWKAFAWSFLFWQNCKSGSHGTIPILPELLPFVPFGWNRQSIGHNSHCRMISTPIALFHKIKNLWTHFLRRIYGWQRLYRWYWLPVRRTVTQVAPHPIATMYGFSNDWFFATSVNSTVLAQNSDISSTVQLYNDGTAIDQFPGAGLTQFNLAGTPLVENAPISLVPNPNAFTTLPSISNIIKITLQ